MFIVRHQTDLVLCFSLQVVGDQQFIAAKESESVRLGTSGCKCVTSGAIFRGDCLIEAAVETSLERYDHVTV